MEQNAPLWKLNRERSWVVAVPFAASDGLVGDEPSVSTAAPIPALGVPPSCDVALVLIFDPHSEPVEFGSTCFGEVKNIFVAVCDVALAIDWFEVTFRNTLPVVCNGDGFYPVDRVLEHEGAT